MEVQTQNQSAIEVFSTKKPKYKSTSEGVVLCLVLFCITYFQCKDDVMQVSISYVWLPLLESTIGGSSGSFTPITYLYSAT